MVPLTSFVDYSDKLQRMNLFSLQYNKEHRGKIHRLYTYDVLNIIDIYDQYNLGNNRLLLFFAS